MKYLFLLLFGLFSCSSLVQQGQKVYVPTLNEEDKNKQYNSYQTDFLRLAALCEEGFPLIDHYFPAKQRHDLEHEIVIRLGQQDVNEKVFTVLSRKYLAHFHNQHTNISTTATFKEEFPFTIYNQQDEWYLLDIISPLNKELIGKRIVAVNKLPVNTFIEKLGEYVFAENEVGKRKAVVKEGLYKKSEFLKLADIIPQSDSLLLEVEGFRPFWIGKRVEKETEEIVMRRPEKRAFHPITGNRDRAFQYQLFPNKGIAYLQLNYFHDKEDMLSAVNTYVNPAFQPLTRLYLKNQFRRKEPSSNLINLYDPLRPSFQAYLWGMMSEMDSLKVDHLVIDLRNNPGGNLMLCKQLLYFLSEKPELNDFNKHIYTSEISRFFQPQQYRQFKNRYTALNHRPLPTKQLFPLQANAADIDFFERIRDPKSPYYIAPNRPVFNGPIYVLADWSSRSAAALLTTLLQDNGLGTVIGTSVGNNPTGPTAYTPFVLPHTKAKGSIASTFFSRPDSSKQEIFQPDYWVEPGVEDFLLGRDPAWEKALDLIQKESLTYHRQKK